MKSRPSRRAAALAIGTLAATSIIGGITAPSVSAADKVIVFYTQCDKLSATDTVKVKRVDEDGKNAVTIGDTGIAHCVANGSPAPAVFLTGFAVSGAYGYFSWQKSDDSGVGIGRIRLDGSSVAEREYVKIPSPAKSIQMSPRVANGSLYFYLDDGYFDQSTLKNPRIARVSLGDGSISTVYAPEFGGGARNGRLSFGVGKSNLFVATSDVGEQQLDKLTFDGTLTRDYFNFLRAPNGADSALEFRIGAGANLVAESDDTLFLYTFGAGTVGLSTISSSSPGTSLQSFKAIPATPDGPGGFQIFQVWGGNYLYYQDATGLKIGRTTKDGAVDETWFSSFATTGWVHHISPALESTVTVTTSTSSSSSSSSSSSTSSSSSSTSSSTSTTVATNGAPTVPKSGGLPAAKVASFLKMTVPKGAKIGLAVAAPSKKVCAVRSGKLVALSSGDCKVTATVTPKTGKSTRKSVTLKTS